MLTVIKQYREEIQKSYKRIENRSEVITTRLGPVEVARRAGLRPSGHAGGPALSPALISHGICGGFDQALTLGDILNPAQAIIAPSRFGYLRSPQLLGGTPEDQAEAYVALLDALGIDKVTMIGVSAGGPSAIHFAAKYPQRCEALILVGAVSQQIRMPWPVERAQYHLFKKNYVMWPIARYFRPTLMSILGVEKNVQKQMTDVDQKWFDDLADTLLPVPPRRKGFELDFRNVTQLEALPANQIRIQTLIIHSEDDQLVPARQSKELQSKIPGARIHLYKQGGHLFFGAKPEMRVVIETNITAK